MRWEAASVCRMPRRITEERSIPSHEGRAIAVRLMIVPVREYHWAPQDAEKTPCLRITRRTQRSSNLLGVRQKI
jgi:hypothetical protein